MGEIKMKEKTENEFLAREDMTYEEITELNKKILRAIRETDIELGAL